MENQKKDKTLTRALVFLMVLKTVGIALLVGVPLAYTARTVVNSGTIPQWTNTVCTRVCSTLMKKNPCTHTGRTVNGALMDKVVS
jgi:hypothetical protein